MANIHLPICLIDLPSPPLSLSLFSPRPLSPLFSSNLVFSARSDSVGTVPFQRSPEDDFPSLWGTVPAAYIISLIGCCLSFTTRFEGLPPFPFSEALSAFPLVRLSIVSNYISGTSLLTIAPQENASPPFSARFTTPSIPPRAGLSSRKALLTCIYVQLFSRPGFPLPPCFALLTKCVYFPPTILNGVGTFSTF